ncbi:signal receiver domain-containing protein [Candidatus Nitrososphaera gargensis Ga9.2]|uniref:Signal receiver domain-containing protein n=1 Tax=Nitrososphaera gargensis (strain Ga9.2) TaxID=1237085 RepID=K0ILV3_NITGG
MTGFELARRIKDVKPDVKVIIMTASEINRLEFENVLPSTKIDGFVTKPATLKVVCVAIERCLG